MTRVQIPAYTDRWMMGDRYGTVTKTTKRPGVTAVNRYSWIAHVHLDKSGKTVRVLLDDCRVL